MGYKGAKTRITLSRGAGGGSPLQKRWPMFTGHDSFDVQRESSGYKGAKTRITLSRGAGGGSPLQKRWPMFTGHDSFDVLIHGSRCEGCHR